MDECVTNRVAISLREVGYDAWHVTEVGRRGRPDHRQLEYAAEQGRMLLTYNVADFVELDRDWTMTGRFHAGILLANDRTYQRNPAGLVSDIRSTFRYYRDAYGEQDPGWRHNQVVWVRRGSSQ